MNDSDKTKEQLIQEIELLRTLINTIPDRLYVKDVKGRFVICNKAVEGDTDLSVSGSPIGKNDFDLFPSEIAGDFYTAEQEIIKTGKPIVNDEVHRTRRKDGKDNWSLCTKLPWRDKDGNIIGIIGANRDITERKMAETALHESETRYKAVFESAREGILVVDAETKQLKFTNPAFCSMFGYTAEELAQMTIKDIHPGKHLSYVLADFGAHAEGKSTFSHNIPCLRKNGDTFYVDIGSTNAVIDGRPFIIGFFTDTTERKRTEEELLWKTAILESQVEATIDGLLIVDSNNQKILTNKRLNSMWKLPPHIADNKDDTAQIRYVTSQTKYPEQFLEKVNYLYSHKNETSRDEVEFKDGTVFDRYSAPVVDKNGKYLGRIWTFRDITERKHIEDALRESEQKYRLLVEQLPAITYTASLDETIAKLYVSPQTQEMLGVTPDEYTADPDLWQKLLHTDDRNRVMAEIAHSHQTGEPFNSEYRMLAKDGHIVWVRDNAKILKDDKGNPLYLQGVMYDITASKQAEEALRESEARYKAIFNFATEGIVVTDVETKQHRYANPAFCRMFGYTAEQLQQMTVYDIHPKEYLTSVIAGLEAQARGEVTLVPNVPCLHKNGTIFYADVDATSVVIDQRPCNVGLFTNITERKRAEEALRESEEKFRGIAERSFDIIFTMDTNGNFKYVSPACEKLYNLKPEEVIGKNFRYFITEGYLPSTIEYFTSIIKGHILKPFVTELQREDFAPVFVEVNMSPVLQNGKVVEAQGVIRDITERKRAEEALRESEEKYRGLAERSFDMIFMTDTHGFIKYLSPACKRIFGYKPEEMVGKHFANFLIEPEIPKATKRFAEKLRGLKRDVLYLEAKKKNGSRVFIELNSSLVIQDGKISGTQGIIKDVTERRKAEEQLRKAHEELETRVKQRTADLAGVVKNLQNEITERKRAEESLRGAEMRFRTVFENTIVGLYRTTPSGQLLLANPALIKMMGCRSFKELAKFNIEKNGYDPSTPRSIFKQRIKKEGRVIGLESIWRRPNGTKLFISESAFAVKDAKGKIIYYEGTAHDITKRKEAEGKLMLYQQQLRSLASELSLAEERLRRRIAAELHDHIAQNLAISKIKLESLTDSVEPGLVKSLNEVSNLISETIGATRSLTFEISPPVLYELGLEAAINWLAKQTRQRFGLEVEFADDGKPKPLNPDIRVLLFQAVRESLVNIVKHAEAKKAKVFICRNQKTVRVTVEDNGVGFDVEAISTVKDPSKGGFGLFNIRERLDQIGGSVIINTKAGKGTQIILTAPVEKQEKPRTRFSSASSDKNRKRRKKKERLA